MASKRQTIMNAALAALEGINVSSGYHNDVVAVYRGLRYLEDLKPDVFPCLCLAGIRETRENITRPHFKAAVRVTIIGYVSKTREDQNLQEILDDFIEDTTKALEADRTFGGTASWSELQNIETDRGDLEKNGAFAMEIVFHYVSSNTTP